MADLTITIGINATGAAAGAAAAKTAIKGVGDEAVKTAAKMKTVAGINFAAVGKQMAAFGTQMKAIGAGMVSAGMSALWFVTGPIALLGAGVLKAGIGYEKALNIFQAVTKATGDEMAAAAKRAEELGADMTLPATSAKDAALAMSELGKAGLTAAQSMDAAKGVLQLAAAGQLDEAKAAEIAANALNAFKLQASETVSVADLLAAAANASSAEVSDIALSMQQASAVFAGAKVPIEDLTAAIGLMANAGIKGSDAGTSLKTFMQRLQSPMKAASQWMQKLGIDIYDAGGKMQSLPQIIGQFEKALAGLTDEQKAKALNKIFGSDAIRAAQILFSTGEQGFAKMKGAVTQQGAAADLAAARTKGLGGAWDAFKSQLETIGIKIYNAIKEPLTNVLLQAAVAAGRLGEAFSGLSPWVQQAVIIVLALVAALGPVLIILGLVVGAIGTLASALGAIAGAIAAIGLPAFIAIILAVVAALAQFAAIAAVVYAAWVSNFGGIRDLTQTIADAVVALWNAALSALSDLTSSIMAEVSKFWQENGDQIIEGVRNVSNAIKAIWTAVVNFWREHGETIKAVASAVWNAVKAIVVGVVSIILNTIKLFLATARGDWSAGMEAIKSIFGAALNALVKMQEAGAALIVGAIKLLFQAVWDLGSWVLEQAANLGKYLGEGLAEGIRNSAPTVGSAAKWLITLPLSIFRSEPKIESPSKITTEIGEFLGQGLADGMRNKLSIVKQSAKTLAQEAIKELKDAAKEFGRLAGASPETVRTIQQANTLKDAASKQQEIIRLRSELGENAGLPLPGDVPGTEAELKQLQKLKEKADEFKQLMDDLEKAPAEMSALLEKEVRDQITALADKKEAIRAAGNAEVIALQEEISLVGVIDPLEKSRIKNYYDIQRLREQMQNDGFSDDQIAEAVAIQKAENGRRLELERILEVRKQVAQAGDLEANLRAEIEQYQRAGAEITVYEKTLRELQTTLKDISPEQKQRILDLAAEADAWKSLERQQKQVKDVIGNLVDAGIERGWKGVLDSVRSMFKQWLKQMFIDFLTSQFFKLFNLGGSSPGGQGSGGGIFSGIFGGGGAGSSGSGSGGNFIQQIFGQGGQGLPFGGGGGNGTGSITILPNGEPAYNVRPGGGWFGSGIFAPQKNLLTGKTSALAGRLSGIGAIASVVGSFIPGKLGNVISYAGTGASIGAMFGPWGAAIGAGIGALIGLFSGDPKRKRDKNEKIPQLNRGFSDSLAELRQLVLDVRTLRVSPDSAIGRATELRNAIASGFGIQFESSKYRKQAQSQIAAKLREADALIEELRAAAEVARAAAAREQRILPEFASGVFMSDDFRRQMDGFRKRNGVLPGAFTGRDTLPSLLAPGEIVINPRQRQNVIRNAGIDPFRGAGIPGYAAGGVVGSSPQPAAASAEREPMNLTFVFEHSVDARGMVRTQIKEAPDVQKEIKIVIEDKFANDEVRQKRRGV